MQTFKQSIHSHPVAIGLTGVGNFSQSYFMWKFSGLLCESTFFIEFFFGGARLLAI